MTGQALDLSLEAPLDLAAEHERLTQLLYQIPVGVMRCAADGAVELMNPLVARLLAHLLDRWTGDSVFDLLETCLPDLRALMSGAGASPAGAPAACALVFEGRRVHVPSPLPGGEAAWLSVTAMRLSQGEFALVVNDITREVAREQQIRQASAWITALVQGSTAHMACEVDAHGVIVEWAPSAHKLTGWSADEVLGRHCSMLFADDFAVADRIAARLRRAARDGWDLDEGWQRRRDAPPFFGNCIITALGERSESAGPDTTAGDVEPSGARFALVSRDVTDRREAAEALRRMTVLDFLTGAHNRAYLFTVGEQELARAKLAGQPVSMVLLDADRFKAINDTHGHDAGDVVLKRIAAICQRQLRADDLLARLGGEEFCVFLPGCDVQAATRLAERMRGAIEREVVVHDGRPIRVTASFGVTGGCGLGLEMDLLVRSADAAVYRAKADGRNAVRVGALALPV